MQFKINKMNRNRGTFILLFLALISAFGPIVTDLYLPALPQLNQVFNTNTSTVQLSLTVSFLGLAIGQMLFGPLSDKYGRKKPLVVSLALFILSTIGCIYSTGIGAFIFFRLLQGFAGAGGIVIARSIAVDLYKGPRLAKFMSMIAAIMGLAPILAPIAGGYILKITDWQGIFFILLLIGIAIFLLSLIYQESLAPMHRLQGPVATTFGHFLPILKNRKFIHYTLALSFAMGGFFGYISASPYIFQKVYQLSPLQFSLAFGLNACGFIIGSQLTRLFKDPRRALLTGITGFVFITIVLGALLVTKSNVAWVEGCFFMMILSLGMMTPVLTTLALELERKKAGNASALLGFSQFLFGCIASPLVGIGNVAFSTGITLVTSSLLCSYFILKTFKEENQTANQLIEAEKQQPNYGLA